MHKDIRNRLLKIANLLEINDIKKLVKVKEWPNKLGFNVGLSEIFRMGLVKEDPNKGLYAFGVRYITRAKPEKSKKCYDNYERPTDEKLIEMVIECRKSGTKIE